MALRGVRRDTSRTNAPNKEPPWTSRNRAGKAARARSLKRTQNLAVIDALRDTPPIRFILTRHEQGAAFMAYGFARPSKGGLEAKPGSF